MLLQGGNCSSESSFGFSTLRKDYYNVQLGAAVGESQVQIQTLWWNKHLESRILLFNLKDQKVDLSSLLFINLTTAVNRGDDLDCRVFMCMRNVDCWLQLEAKRTLLTKVMFQGGEGEKEEKEPEETFMQVRRVNTIYPVIILASLVANTPLNNHHPWWKSFRRDSGTNVSPISYGERWRTLLPWVNSWLSLSLNVVENIWDDVPEVHNSTYLRRLAFVQSDLQ